MRSNPAGFLTRLASMLFVACAPGLFFPGSSAAGMIDLKTAAPDYTVFGVNGDDFTGQTVVFGDGSGTRVPSGVYFAQMEYAGRTLERKLLVLR